MRPRSCRPHIKTVLWTDRHQSRDTSASGGIRLSVCESDPGLCTGRLPLAQYRQYLIPSMISRNEVVSPALCLHTNVLRLVGGPAGAAQCRPEGDQLLKPVVSYRLLHTISQPCR
jgi:hypothetical protein